MLLVGCSWIGDLDRGYRFRRNPEKEPEETAGGAGREIGGKRTSVNK